MEKVLQALEHCDLCSDMPNCPGCAYLREPDCMEHLKRDIIALLKAKEPRYGEWKWSHGGECSECGFHNSNFDYRFCPMCGAVMDRR